MIVYCLIGLIATPLFNKLALFSSVVACISSVYLGCLLAFVLKDFCLVCITTYIINAALLWLNVQKVYSNINERRF
jgi:vitamin-K-epoxide reductase (warfarin-sensitive)